MIFGETTSQYYSKKEEKKGEFPDKFEIEDVSQHKSTVTFLDRRVQIIF